MDTSATSLPCAFCGVVEENSFPEEDENFRKETMLRQFWREFISASSKEGDEQGLRESESSKPRNGRRKKQLVNDTETILENSTVCDSCLQHVEKAVGSKVALRGREVRVEKLQKEILEELHGLVGEVDKLCGELGVIEGILERGEKVEGRRLVSAEGKRGRPLRNRVSSLFHQFKERVGDARRNIQCFNGQTSERLLLPKKGRKEGTQRREVPQDKDTLIKLESNISTKVEISDDNEDEAMPDFGDDGGLSDANDDLPQANAVPCPPAQDDAGSSEESEDLPTIASTRTRRKVSNVPSKSKPIKFSDDSTGEEDVSSDSDLDFDPTDIASQQLHLARSMKGLSIFRRNIIMSVKNRDTIIFSKGARNKDDPRSNYTFKYNSSKGTFVVGNVDIICLDDEKKLKCSQCDFTSFTRPERKDLRCESIMFEHILTRHLFIYTCKICHHPSTSYHGSELHKFIAHGEESPCPICGRPLARSSESYKSHMWLHLNEEEKADPANHHLMPIKVKRPELNERRFQCATCGKGFKCTAGLRKHQEIHENLEVRQTMCPDCGKLINTENLEKHQNFCKKPKHFVPCLVCNERLQNTKRLLTHMRKVHPNERPYKCTMCDKTFNTKNSVSVHIKLHSATRSHLCPKCGAAFKEKRTLAAHMQTCQGVTRRRGRGVDRVKSVEQTTGMTENNYNQGEMLEEKMEYDQL